MIVADIARRIAALRELECRDPEAAAAGAEELRNEVLAEIADGAPNAQALAAAAMVTIYEEIGDS